MKIQAPLLLFFFITASSLCGQSEELVCKDLYHIVEVEKRSKEAILNFRASEETSNYDLKYHRLEWRINPAQRYIEGTVTSYFEPEEDNFNRLYFDLSQALTVEQVTYQGQNVPFAKLANDLLRIDLPTDLPAGQLDSVSVTYEGVPPNNGFGSFEARSHQGVPIVWTLSEPYGAKDWWPCKQSLDDKIDSIDVLVRTPAQYRAASNGLLVNEITDGFEKIYHWQHRYPIPAYLIAVGVTNYSVFSDWVPLTNGDSVEVLNYVYPENEASIRSAMQSTVESMQLFNDLFGMYPFADEKYGHAQFGWGGGMEHQTMSFMGAWSHSLQAHELAHQWFGDKITCGSWEDIWLNEGFATYLDGLTYENGLGNRGWRSWLQSRINAVTSQPGGSVWVTDTTSVSRIFNGRLSYSKGAMLLHMLRWQLGDEDFFQAVRNYLNDPALAFAYAKTEDLQAHLEMQSGQDLEAFFADWFYGEGYPSYQVYWEQEADQRYEVQLFQTTSLPSSVDFFDMPVPVLFRGNNQEVLQVFDHTYSGEVFEIELSFEPVEVIFDPEFWLISKNNTIDNREITSSSMTIDELDKKLRLYPNPARNQISLSFEDWPGFPKQMELLNVQGQLLRTFETSDDRLEILLTSLPAGEYIVSVQTPMGKLSRRFLKVLSR